MSPGSGSGIFLYDSVESRRPSRNLFDLVLTAMIALRASQESQTMIFRQHPVFRLTLAFFAAISFSATTMFGLPHFGAKKQQDPIAVRKLTPGQSALIDRAIVREHALVAAVKDRDESVLSHDGPID